MCSSPGDVSEEHVTLEKQKKGWRMSCNVGKAKKKGWRIFRAVWKGRGGGQELSAEEIRALV